MSPADSSSSNPRGRRRSNRRRQHHHAASGAPDAPLNVPDHPMIPGGEPQWVQSQRGFDELIGHARGVGCFAYDTEFIGELSYFPKLCLIQIATPQIVAVVDGLCGLDFTPLWELIADPAVRVLVHAGGQDLEPVVRHLDKSPANVLDTQIAAGFLGLPYPAALSKLVEHLLGVRLGKSLTFTSWDERPLSKGHLRYAGDDVRYLPALVQTIDQQLESLGHASWAMTECEALCDKSAYGFDPVRQLGRVRSGRSLAPKAKRVLMELLIERDAGAREHDLPPRSFLADEVLVEIARRPPKSREALADLRGMPRPVAAEYGQRFLEAVERAYASDRGTWPRDESPDESLADKGRVDALWAALQSYCAARKVDSSLVTSRTEISKVYFSVTRHGKLPEARVAESWRGELLGDFVVRFLGGDQTITLGWADGGLSLEQPEGQ